MKKILLILAFIWTSTSYCQLSVVESSNTVQVGKVSVMGQLVISLEKIDDLYIFTYRDNKFTQVVDYKSFEFKETGKDLSLLYQEIVKGIEVQPEDHITIKLPKGYLFLKFGKMMGSKYVEIGHALDDNADVIGFSRGLTKKDIDKLFGLK